MTSSDDDGADRPTASSAAVPSAGRNAATGGRAFDLWLNRGLHAIFDDIASEPVPEDLLRLIEDDRSKSHDEGTGS